MPDFQIATKPANKRPGVGRYIWYTSVDEVTLATVPASPTTQAEKVTIDDDHTFASTSNGWRKMWIDQETSNVIFAGVGAIGSKGATGTIQVMIPGTKKEVAAFIKDDPELVILVPNPDCDGEYLQLGNACSPLLIQPDYEFKTGTVSGTDMKGFTINLKYTTDVPTWYTGVVTEPTA